MIAINGKLLVIPVTRETHQNVTFIALELLVARTTIIPRPGVRLFVCWFVAEPF